MKMNKPYIEVVRFDADDVIATSGVVNCGVSSNSGVNVGDNIMHYDHYAANYFNVVYNSNNQAVRMNEYGDTLSDDKGTVKHNGHTQSYSDISAPSSTSNGISAYLYDDTKGWYWWDDDYSNHNY